MVLWCEEEGERKRESLREGCRVERGEEKKRTGLGFFLGEKLGIDPKQFEITEISNNKLLFKILYYQITNVGVYL